MQVDLVVDSSQGPSEDVSGLQDWLKRERLDGVTSIKRKTESAKPGEMGVLDLSTLEVILSAKVVVGLVTSIHLWIKHRRKKIIVKLKARGKSIDITSENISAEDMKLLLDGLEG
jgi:hypothetical protein